MTTSLQMLQLGLMSAASWLLPWTLSTAVESHKKTL